jgi:hypothetical protein
MWQGIVAGATYDAVKAAVRAALVGLRGANVAPSQARPEKRTKTKLEFGWRDVADKESCRRELYLRLSRTYRERRVTTPGRVEKIGTELGASDLNKARAPEVASAVYRVARKLPSVRKPKRKRGRARR